MALLSAILLWDRRKCVSFCSYASRIIQQKVGNAMSVAKARPPGGRPLRVMLPQSPNPADIPFVTADEVAKAMRCLPDVQRNILERLFCKEPETLESIGRTIGINKERVRQVKLSALRRLRMEITGEPPPQKPRKPQLPCA